jgi:DNA-binding transcriptional regulator LsrR (DeoR family)
MNDRSAHLAMSAEQQRLMAVVARLYHVHGVRQSSIAQRLEMSQARVSRLLRQAEDYGITRTVLVVPEGLYPDYEDRLERAYGLLEAHVVDVAGGDEELPQALGAAAARYLASATVSGAVVGFTSWSTTLQEMTRSLQGLPRSGTTHVVEMLGDLGSPPLQHQAAEATHRLAEALGAEPVFLRTPGVAVSPVARELAFRDAHVQRVLQMLDRLDVAFVGIGPPAVHSALREGDNFFSAADLATVRAQGAVGQVNQRFVDAKGKPVDTPLDDLVVGVTPSQLRRVRRRIVVAGGSTKRAALAAALAGGWVDVLMTDLRTARHLVSDLQG